MIVKYDLCKLSSPFIGMWYDSAFKIYCVDDIIVDLVSVCLMF